MNNRNNENVIRDSSDLGEDANRGEVTSKDRLESIQDSLDQIRMALSNLPSPQRTKIALLSEHLSAWAQTGYRVLLLFSLIFLIVVFFLQLGRDHILVEPIEVSDNLQKEGYTGVWISNKLIDQLTTISSTAATNLQRPEFLAAWHEPSPELELKGEGLSLGLFTRFVRDAFGFGSRRITGEALLSNDLVSVAVRLVGKQPVSLEGRIAEFDTFLLRVAEQMYRHIDPYVLATYYYTFDKDLSMEAARFCIQNPPLEDDAVAYNLLGVLLQESGEVESAIQKYQRAIELDASLANAYNNWANVLSNRGDFENAIRKYREATELDPKFAAAYNNWGVTLSGQGKHDEAIEKFIKAIDITPDYASAYNHWGAALYDQHRWEEAREMYERAIELDPSYPKSYHNLALYYCDRKGDVAKAIELWSQYVQVESDTIEANKARDLIRNPGCAPKVS